MVSGSKSAHVSWGEDRKRCQVVNLPMFAGEWIKKGVRQ
jgi:hypothetical protein